MSDWGTPRLFIGEEGVTLAYSRKGQEPPPDVDGWRRLKDKWRFVLDYGVECPGMLAMIEKRCCGVQFATIVCNGDNSPLKSLPVPKQACLDCRVRESLVRQAEAKLVQPAEPSEPAAAN